MRFAEVRGLLTVQRPKLSRTTRVLERCVTIDDLRREA